MKSLEQKIFDQLQSIAEKTGKSLKELREFAAESGITKHGQLRKHLKKELGLNNRDANALAHYVRRPEMDKKKPW